MSSRRGVSPVIGSGEFLYAYGTQANANRVGLLYAFKMPGGAKPKFTLRTKDGFWYYFYRQEIQTLWDAGSEWGCEDNL